jgi:hypothetical protein
MGGSAVSSFVFGRNVMVVRIPRHATADAEDFAGWLGVPVQRACGGNDLDA